MFQSRNFQKIRSIRHDWHALFFHLDLGCQALERKGCNGSLTKVLLEEVIKSFLLQDPKTISAIRDTEDCMFDVPLQ